MWRKEIDGDEEGDCSLHKSLDTDRDGGEPLAEFRSHEGHREACGVSRSDHLPEFQLLFSDDRMQTVCKEIVIGKQEIECLCADDVRSHNEQSFENCLIDLRHRDVPERSRDFLGGGKDERECAGCGAYRSDVCCEGSLWMDDV